VVVGVGVVVKEEEHINPPIFGSKTEHEDGPSQQSPTGPSSKLKHRSPDATHVFVGEQTNPDPGTKPEQSEPSQQSPRDPVTKLRHNSPEERQQALSVAGSE